jgi:hypothetical protein
MSCDSTSRFTVASQNCAEARATLTRRGGGSAFRLKPMRARVPAKRHPEHQSYSRPGPRLADHDAANLPPAPNAGMKPAQPSISHARLALTQAPSQTKHLQHNPGFPAR